MTLLAPALFVLLWSTGFIVARAIAGHTAPALFLTARFALAALLLAALACAWPSCSKKTSARARSPMAWSRTS